MRFSIVLVLMVFAPCAAAWETDVHYGLTKWLALQAGFPDKDAEDIAQGTLLHDTGGIGPVMLGVYSCIRDRNSAFTIRDRHFPSFTDPPGAPVNRQVKPNSAKAKSLLETAMSDERNSLTEFGRALHAYQDSWSHQGVPDVAPLCSTDYGYAHPDMRGGWFQHYADQTFRYMNDTLETAKNSYEMLLQLYGKRYGKQSPSPAWSMSQAAAVMDFAKRQTWSDKADWFKDHGFKVQWPYLAGISLPYEEKQLDTLRRLFRQPRANGNPVLVNNDKREVVARQFVDQFLSDWISQAGKPRKNWLEPYADFKALQQNLGKRHGVDGMADIYAAFEMWLVEDHGLLAVSGHGARGSWQQTRTVIEKSGKIVFKDVPEALEPQGEGRAPYVVLADKSVLGSQYGDVPTTAVFLRLRHSPRDTLVLVFRTDGEKPRIIDIVWIVDE